MDTRSVTCPICNKNVRSYLINTHIDTGCSDVTAISDKTPSQDSGSQSKVSRTPLTHKKAPKSTPGNLAPIFTSGNIPASTPNIHSKRAAEVDSPTPIAKRQKSGSGKVTLPFAERLRPRQFSDFIGQTHLIEPSSLISTMLMKNANWSIILWGPPGCGKTTLAKLVAEKSDAIFKELSATASGVNEVKNIVDEAKKSLALLNKRTILFLDEIHRFNRTQQDIFLPFIEQGQVQLIGATTENPSFRLTGALLSRCRVLRLEPLSESQMTELLTRALQQLDVKNRLAEEDGPEGVLEPQFKPRILSSIVSMAAGDARTALSLLEVALHYPKGTEDKQILGALEQSLVVSYDRTGEDHYDLISALHKSVRGSHGSAAMYWLARMLTAGEDPIFIARRMVVCASEDIGLADAHALPLAMATLQACQVIGMPECRINLAHIVAYLSEAPKSTRAYEAYKRAEAAAKQTARVPVPMQIRNAPTNMMEEMGYGKNYHYNPDYRHPVHNNYLPPEVDDQNFLLKEGDESGKLWDEGALCEWEKERNEGNKWEGRA